MTVAAHFHVPLAVHLVLHAMPKLLLGIRDAFFLDVVADRLGNILAGLLESRSICLLCLPCCHACYAWEHVGVGMLGNER